MEFSTLKYNLRGISLADLFKTYPELYSLYTESLAIVNVPKGENPHIALTAEQAVALVVYTYHQSSPLVRQYANMHLRRRESLKLLEFTLESAEDLINNPDIAQYITGANRFVNHMAIQFCKFEPNSSKWVELCRKQDMLDDVFLVLKEDQAGAGKKSAAEVLAVKMKLEEQGESLQVRINQLSTEIFAGDTGLTPLAAAHVIMEQRKPVISPERYVARKREKRAA